MLFGGLVVPILGATAAAAESLVSFRGKDLPMVVPEALAAPMVPPGTVFYGGRVILETSAGPLALPYRSWEPFLTILGPGDTLDLTWTVNTIPLTKESL
jgi:hypothetical protein